MPTIDLGSCFRTLQKTLLVFCASCLLASCALLEDEKNAENEKDKSKKEAGKDKENRFEFLKKEQKKAAQPPPQTLEEEKLVVKSPAPNENKIARLNSMARKGKTLEQTIAGRVPAKGHFYDEFILLNADEELDVSLVFNNAPIIDVIPAFADVLGFNFTADSDIKGNITLNLNSKMTRRELWNTFEKMLYLANCGAKVSDSLVRVMLMNKLTYQSDARLAIGGDGEIHYYHLKNATGREAITQLKPFLRRDAVCVELSRPNAIMICDIASNMPKIRQLVDLIDRNAKSTWPRVLIPCRNILPSKIADELRVVLPTLGFTVYQTADRTELPGSIQLTGIDRIQVLAATAATEEAITEIKTWVELLDSTESLDQEMVFVYKVRHGKVVQLAQALSVIYDTTGATLTVDSSTGNSRTTNLTSPRTTSVQRQGSNVRTATVNTTATGARGSIVQQSSLLTDQDSSVFNTTVRVFADGVLNRMIIRTTPRTYASIKALLDRLDVVPAQVLLQVLVVEVTLTDSTQFGLEFSMQNVSGSKAESLFGTNYSNLNPDLDTVGGGGDKGFSYLLSNPNNPSQKFGYVKALAGNTAVKVVSSPQLLVASNTDASIQVGSRVPLLTQSVTDTASVSTAVNSFQYYDTGIILNVTPQITSTDLISLDVKQTLSDAVPNTTSTIESPVITQRIVETSMTIANGQTMVIGGLIQEKRNDSLSSLPFINQIPVINRLLGSTDASVERSEILVLITGYIVNERSPVEEMIKRYNEAINELNTFNKNIGEKPSKRATKPAVLFEKDFWL